MNSNLESHPSDESLHAFGLGKLDDGSSRTVADHLETCVDCRQRVASVSGDTLLNRLQDVRRRDRESGVLRMEPATGGLTGEFGPLSPAAAPTPARMPPELANHSQYEVIKELGKGGMGIVYLARNKLMDRLEVLKVLNQSFVQRPGALERFLREIQTAAKLRHENVVGAYSALRLGNALAFAMEYVAGQDLSKLVKAQGPLPVTHACHYARQAALGLQHAHEKGMVHRDIKPQNLILSTEGNKRTVKILDFGLAKATREKKFDPSLTSEGAMLGTPDYIAPEQSVDASRADIRADIYSLGCTLYYLLTGKPPFQANNVFDLLLKHQADQAPRLDRVRPEIPSELADVVARMMAKDPAQRYQKPLDTAQALTAFLKPALSEKAAPETSITEPAGVDFDGPTSSPSGRSPGRRRLWIGGVALSLTTLGLLLASGVLSVRSPEKPIEPEPIVQSTPRPPLTDGAEPHRDKSDHPKESTPAPVTTPVPKPMSKELVRQGYLNRLGHWRIEGDQLVQTTRQQYCELVFGDPQWQDFDFSCEVKKMTPDNEIGLIYRVTGSGRDDFCRIVRKDAGNFAALDFARSFHLDRNVLDRRQAAGIDEDRWYKLEVRVRGDVHQCYVDDQLKIQYEDRSNTRGRVGVRTWLSPARFKNFRVVDAAGDVLFEGLPSLPMRAVQWPPPDAPATAEEIACFKEHRSPVTGVAFLADGRVASCSDAAFLEGDDAGNASRLWMNHDSALRVWNATTGQEIARSPIDEDLRSNRPYSRIAAHPSAPMVLSLTPNPVCRVRTWDVGKDVLALNTQLAAGASGVIAIQITADGKKAIAVNGSGTSWEWSLENHQLLRKTDRTLSNVSALQVSPSGEFFITAFHDRSISLSRLDASTIAATWRPPLGVMRCVAISNDGSQALWGDVQGHVQLWDVLAGKGRGTMTGKSAPVRCVAFSPDGRLAISGGEDRTVSIWDLTTKSAVASFTGHTGCIRCVAFSPDGQMAASGSDDYTVRVWRLPASVRK